MVFFRRIFTVTALTLCISIMSSSCNPKSKVPTIVVGIDTSFPSTGLPGSAQDMYAYFLETMYKVGQECNVRVELVNVPVSMQLDSLSKGNVDCILTTNPVTQSSLSLYSFSIPLLLTGDVVAVPAGKGVVPYKGRLGATSRTTTVFELEKSGRYFIEYYDTPQKALLALERGKVDGAVIDSIVAARLINDTFYDSLVIATTPSKLRGYRLMSVSGRKELNIRTVYKCLRALSSQKILENKAKALGLAV